MELLKKISAAGKNRQMPVLSFNIAVAFVKHLLNKQS